MINIFEPYLNKKEIIKNINYCIRNNWISSQGKFVKSFERKFEKLFHSKHAISVNSNTSGLYSAMAAIGLCPGDEVIVTNQDHEANISPWRRLEEAGAKIVELKINPETAELEIETLEKVITNQTKIVAVTHCSNIVGTILEQ